MLFFLFFCFIWNYITHVLWSILAQLTPLNLKTSYVFDNHPISGLPFGMYVSETSTCTLCKSLVMMYRHHIMNNTNKCMNKMCCINYVN